MRTTVPQHRIVHDADPAIRSGRFWAIVLAVIVLDAMSKLWAVRTLTQGVPWPSVGAPVRLWLDYNSDLDFGITLPRGGRILYSLLAALMVACVLRMGSHLPLRARTYVNSFGLLAGGGFANLVERLVHGSVTDFIDMGVGSFNFADVAITCGGLLYAFVRCRDGRREEGWTWRGAAWTIPRVFPPSIRERR